MYKEMILKFDIKEKSDKVIDLVIEKIIADSSVGTCYVRARKGDYFCPHSPQHVEIEAELINRERVNDETVKLIFKIPFYFENKEDFFSMFFSITGEPPGFHPKILLEEFYFGGEDDLFNSKNSLTGPEKYSKYLNKKGPFIGTIIKPNIGTSLNRRLELIKKLMFAGVDFLKDDEVFGLSTFDEFKLYVKKVNEIKNELYDKTGRKCVFCFNITSFASRFEEIYNLPIDAIMINFLALGFPTSFRIIEKFKNKAIIHGHRVGSATFLKNNSKKVLIKLVKFLGLDSTHIGTPKKEDVSNEIKKLSKKDLSRILSAFTMVHPGYVEVITKNFGDNVLFLPCGGVYTHPDGPEKGIAAFRTAIDLYKDQKGPFFDQESFNKAIKKWD